MAAFSLFKKSAEALFTDSEKQRIVEAIKQAELRTSGEVRVFIETRCRMVDPIDRAAEIFFGLRMDETAERNAVLVYVAMRDHQFAIFADEGIYKEMGAAYWNEEAAKMLKAFKTESYAEGIVTIIDDIGHALQDHFPYDRKGDKNELPDNIVFGS